jgi:bifunctional UDP-N-acetylglucosamine pyrophosphorylase/glucosamine-1-phosphate N-acetyltransferase
LIPVEDGVSVDVVILAAGQGTRMKSRLPKMLHPLGGKPIITHGVETAAEVGQRPPVVVIGHGAEAVSQAIGAAARFVVQEEQLGTGHAVLQTRSLLEGQSDFVIVMYGDMPLLRPETLGLLLAMQHDHAGPISMTSVMAADARGFGRVVRDERGNVTAIVEAAAATPDQLAIREVNVGLYCFRAEWLWSHLPALKVTPKGEYYITDLVEIAAREGATIQALVMTDPDQALGINNRAHLAEAEAALRRRINREWMLSGVTLLDPDTTYIQPGVTIGQDTVILPNTHLMGRTRIGQECVIGPNTVIEDSTIGDRCAIKSSYVESATVEDGVDVGPFGHLRSGAYLETGVHMGNFGEVKNSRLRRGVKMGHFGYVGDGDVGDQTNIGAGTVFANYDGQKKHRTVIGKKVLIGSDTTLVAPLTVGDGARTGAGSVVTHDVPPGGLVFGVPARPGKQK